MGSSGSGSNVSPLDNEFSSAHRIPTPTEQTPSPRRQNLSNSNPNSNSNGGGGGFAFGFVPSNGHHNISSNSNAGDRHQRRAANAGGGGGGKTRQGEGSGCSPPSWWRGSERGTGEVDDEVEGEGRGGGGPAAFGEELEVFSSALRKDFEVKVRSGRGLRTNAGLNRADSFFGKGSGKGSVRCGALPFL